jgi:transcription-repair coupling factor (superfamily II helicase)
LLKLEVAKLTGKEIKFAHEVNIAIDFVIFARAENAKGMYCALFPASYIPGERLRVDAYRRLAHLSTLEELEDYKAELTDRFGKMPEESRNLFEITHLRILGQMADLRTISVVDGTVMIQSLDGEVYRESNGKRPTLDVRDAPALRIAHLKSILNKILKRHSNATAH